MPGGRSRPDRAAGRDRRRPRVHLRPARRSSSSTPSTPAAPRPGRRPASPSNGSSRRSHNTGLQQAFLTSIACALGATRRRAGARRPGLARGVALSVLRSRDDLVHRASCRSPCRASSPAWRYRRRSRRSASRSGSSRSSSATPRSASCSSTTTPIARLRRAVALVRGGLGRPRRGHVPDVPARDVPGAPVRRCSPAACSPSRCRSTRSSSRSSRPAASRRCRSGSSRASALANQVPLVNVAGLVAILLSVIPVYLAHPARAAASPGARG